MNSKLPHKDEFAAPTSALDFLHMTSGIGSSNGSLSLRNEQVLCKAIFGGSESSSDVDDDNLPYPKPLPRSAFLAADFSPAAYLSSLHNRHQTLEDLRSELRGRSQDLAKELLDLVNTNYQAFLSLGSSLRGGEEKIEEVRVGVLGFRRDVKTIKQNVDEKESEVGTLLDERSRLWEEIRFGRSLLEIDHRLEELEKQLMVGVDRQTTNGIESEGESESDEETDTSDDDADRAGGAVSIPRLKRAVQRYLYIAHLISSSNSGQPFLVAQEVRLTKARNTLLLDLGTALKAARGGNERSQRRLLSIMNLYAEIGEAKEAVHVLRVKPR